MQSAINGKVNILLSKEELELLVNLCEDNEELEDVWFKCFKALRKIRNASKTAAMTENSEEKPKPTRARRASRKTAVEA